MTLIEEVARLRTEMIELRAMGEANRALIDRHEEQINGRRGQSVTLDALATEIKSLRKAAYWVAGIIVAGSITFAFSALTIIGHL